MESELDNLIDLYGRFEEAGSGYHKLLVAAWLHHRFTQIHPFQDGNGRVARALLTWHLTKEEYLPIVVSRGDRGKYIACLESADAGDLNPFVQFIVGLERQIILDALDQTEPVADSGVVSQVLDHIAAQVRRSNQERLEQLRSVNQVATSLQIRAIEYLESQIVTIERQLGEAGLAVDCALDSGGPGDKGHWYRAQVINIAKKTQHWANLNEDRFFVKLSISSEERSQTPRLVFVISLHHLGTTVNRSHGRDRLC